MFIRNMENWNSSYEAILNRTRNCTEYFNTIPALFENIDSKAFEEDVLKYVTDSIAFNIMVHSQPGIMELFFALYFRPDNHYVIHLDKKVQSFFFFL